MDNERFWAYIDTLGGVITEDSAKAFHAALADHLDAAGIRDFAETLQAVLRAIDLETIAGLPVRDVTDDPDGEPLPLMGTALEYFTGALIAAGEATYRAVLADPGHALTRTWQTEDAPLLLDAVDTVHEERTGEVWDEGADYSIVLAAPDDEPPWSWLSVSGSYDIGRPPLPEYQIAQDALFNLIRSSPDWKAWWEPAGREELRLHINFIDEVGREFIRGRKYLSVSYGANYRRLVDADTETLHACATEDLLTALTLAAKRGRLGPLPPMPALPDDLSAYDEWRNAEPYDPVAEIIAGLRARAAEGDAEAARHLEDWLEAERTNEAYILARDGDPQHS